MVDKKTIGLSCILLVFWGATCLAAPAPRLSIGFDNVVDKARALAEDSFNNEKNDLPDALAKIGYDEWRGLRFRPAQAVWSDGPYSLQFFHPGFIYQDPVTVHIVENGIPARVPFSADFFDYGTTGLKGAAPEGIGFAGFRIHYPLNTPDYADELISFLGASYFRALAQDLVYGMSARGLAIDTAEASGEEFPWFREFWIVKPSRAGATITIYALLDSPSVTGAYAFAIDPGEETIMDVQARLFFRRRVKKLGLAPLTSMFSHGEDGTAQVAPDFRPEVHDSDGLLIQEGSGEWTWHPLVNPETLLVNSFGGNKPVGFGLIQRDMTFDHYQDLEARYDRRPSVWVTPGDGWGAGRIELVQIPTYNEYNDNIVAYWVPDQTFEPGDSLAVTYSLTWCRGDRLGAPLAKIASTRVMRQDDTVSFVIDFLPGSMPASPSTATVSADIQLFHNYQIASKQVIANTVTGGWRLILRVDLKEPGILDKVIPNHAPAVELRAFLHDDRMRLSETWSYTYLP